MRSKRRFSRATLVVPVILAMTNPLHAGDDSLGSTSQAPSSQQSIPPVPVKASTQVPVRATTQSGQTPYRSTGPAVLASIPTPQGSSQAPSSLPPIGQVASPYTSSGPAALTVLGTPQGSSQGSGGIGSGTTYLGDGGTMNVPSPYQSTAMPGVQTPGTVPPGGDASQAAPSNLPTSPLSGGLGANPLDVGGAPSSGLGGFGSGAPSYFSMIGDASPFVSTSATRTNPVPPGPPSPSSRSIVAPSVRGFKIAENQSPLPQDRLFFSFNYYNNVNSTLNKFFEANVKGINIYRYVFGYEKTFNNGMGSVGIRLPIDNIWAQSSIKGLNQGGNSTATGDLTVYVKHIFWMNRETGSLTSGGLAISPQTAPGSFGGARYLKPSNTTSFQPFFAYLFRRDRFYLQGFFALDVPVDPSQPTLVYNDIGMGYFVYRDDTFTNFITGIAPTVEVHVNSPINHSGAYNRTDSNGTPDIINITTGLNTRIRQSSVLTLGVVTPVTGPHPFTVEATVLFNYYFGGSRRTTALPIVGG